MYTVAGRAGIRSRAALYQLPLNVTHPSQSLLSQPRTLSGLEGQIVAGS